MKIIMVTDVHIGEDSNNPHFGGTDYMNLYGDEAGVVLKNLFDTTAHDVDLVFNLGDLIHDESYDHDVALYQDTVSLFPKDKTVHVAGNHDLRWISRDELSKLSGNELYFAWSQGGWLHVVLDGSRREPRGPHYIPEEQLVWLQKILENATEPAVIYLHFPLDNQDFSKNYYFKNSPDAAAIANRYFVRRVLERSGNVWAVFCGHTHFYHHSVTNDINYYTIPSFSENNGNNLPNRTYALVTLGEGGHVDVSIQSVIV